MSQGRSGSTVLWQVLTALTNSPPRFKVPEYVGDNQGAIRQFFDVATPAQEKRAYGKGDRHARSTDHVPGAGAWKTRGEWLVDYLCHLRAQEEGRQAFVGFKWKPSAATLRDAGEARDSLRLVAALAAEAAAAEDGARPPPVRVLRSRRNPLDVALSRLKHRESEAGGDGKRLGAHCRVGDAKCLAQASVGRRVVDDVPGLYRNTRDVWESENEVDALLRASGVPVAFVSYDALFYPARPEEAEGEWHRALRFVTEGSPSSSSRRADAVSWADVRGAVRHAATTPSRCHEDVIANWREVYAAFNGTELEHLFRRR